MRPEGNEIENYQDLAPKLIKIGRFAPVYLLITSPGPGYISSEGEFCRFSSFGDRQTGLL